MAWVINDGTRDTINLTVTTGAQCIFALKELLKAVGWTVPSSSDGVTYNAAGDQITQDGTGAGGMNVNYAWFRIQDPGGRRELLFQRYTANYSWIVVYSALDKFIGGAPNATTRPTATDEGGICRGVTAIASAPNLFSISSLGATLQIAAQDTPVGDVYPFWLFYQNHPPVSAVAYILCDGLTQAAANDADPCFLMAADTSNWATIEDGANGSGRGWMRYNEANEEFGLLNAWHWDYMSWGGPGTAQISNGPSPNPIDGKWPLPRIAVGRSSVNGALAGPKGILNWIRWNCNAWAVPYGLLNDDGTNIYLATQALMLPGWPDVTTIPIQ